MFGRNPRQTRLAMPDLEDLARRGQGQLTPALSQLVGQRGYGAPMQAAIPPQMQQPAQDLGMMGAGFQGMDAAGMGDEIARLQSGDDDALRKQKRRDKWAKIGTVMGGLGTALGDLNHGTNHFGGWQANQMQRRDAQDAQTQQLAQKAEQQARLQQALSRMNGGAGDPSMELAALLNPSELGKSIAGNYGFNTANAGQSVFMGGQYSGQAAPDNAPQTDAGQYGADMQNGYLGRGQGQDFIDAGLTQAENDAQAAGQYTLSSGGQRLGLDGGVIAANTAMTDYQRAQTQGDAARLEFDRVKAALDLQGGPKRSLNGVPMMGPNGQFSIGQLTSNGQLAPAAMPDGYTALDPFGKAYQSTAGRVAGKNDAGIQANLPKQGRALEAFGQKVDLLNSDIDRAIGLADKWNTGPAGQFNPMGGGTDLDGLLRTISGNAGFDELQQMRDNSPTGGALGQVSNTEIGLLTALKGDIQRSQSPEQIKRNLLRYKDQYALSMERIQSAYDEALQAGLLGPQQPQGISAPSAYDTMMGGGGASARDWIDAGDGVRIREVQ